MRTEHESTASKQPKSKIHRRQTVGIVEGQRLTYDRKNGAIMLADTPHGTVTTVQRAILNALFKHPLQVVSQERLYRACLRLPQGYEEDPRVVRTYLKPTMHRLRERLNEIHAPLTRTIRSARGLGYMYIPDIQVQNLRRKK